MAASVLLAVTSALLEAASMEPGSAIQMHPMAVLEQVVILQELD